MGALIEVAIAAGGLISNGGGTVAYVRATRRRRGEAIAALDAAADVYGTLVARLASDLPGDPKDKIDTFVASLGETDTVAFRKKADKVLAAIAAVMDAFADTGLSREWEYNPLGRHLRGRQHKLAKRYGSDKGKLLKQGRALDGLLSEIDNLLAQIANFAELRKEAGKKAESARSFVQGLTADGWQVAEFLEEARNAFAWLSQADTSYESRNHLSALNALDEAQAWAEEAREHGEDLTEARDAVVSRSHEFDQQISALRTDIARARRAIRVLVATFAEVCSAGFSEQLDAAVEELTELEQLTAAIRADSTPANFDREETGAKLAEIGAVLEQITETCAHISGSKDRLGGIMAKVHAGIGKQNTRLANLSESARSRDGDQSQIVQAINLVTGELHTLSDDMGVALPDPAALQARYQRLKSMIDRIVRRSRDIDRAAEEEVDITDVVWGVVKVGAVVVGIDWLFGDN